MRDETPQWVTDWEDKQNWVSKLFYGDNLDILRDPKRIKPESVDLVYLDPPFNSNRSYNVLFADKHGATENQAQIEAFGDTWTWTQETERLYFDLTTGGAPNRVADAVQAMHGLLGENDVLAYLVMMAARLVEMHRVLKPTGTLYLHCDPTASHYLKVLLDAIFTPERFLNEVTWQRTTSHGNVGRNFGSITDILLVYTKGENYTWNQQFRPMTAEYAKGYKNQDPDGRLWRSENMRNPGPRPNLRYPYTASNGVTYQPHPNGWICDETRMKKLDAEGRLHFPSKPEGRLRLKMYLDESQGVRLQNLWDDIPAIGSRASERLGYPTQKPLALLERIIATSSSPGDLVLDPFCGCGTTVIAAEKLGRRWIGIDVTYIAIDLMRRRLEDVFLGEAKFEIDGIPRDIPGAHALFARSPFEFERWAVSLVYGQPNEKQVGDRGSDGVIRFPMPQKNTVGRVVVSVKGGGQVGPTMVRDLAGTIDAEKAQMGVLVALTKPTAKMTEAAHHSGSYTWPVDGREYPKVQVVTVEQLLAGHRLEMPPPLSPYSQAQRHVPQPDQMKLG